MKRPTCLAAAMMLIGIAQCVRAADQSVSSVLSLDQCLDLALRQNPTVLKARQELERTRGLIVETRAEAIPQVMATGQYRRIDEGSLDVFPGSPGAADNQTQPWSATVEVTQLVYGGGRVTAAIRAARLSDQISLLDFQRTVADVILEVRRTFYQMLLNQELVKVGEQSVTLLERQLQDVRHRFDVGAVPQFNVLRAEVELANAKPPLIRARNNLRLSREALAKLLAFDSAEPKGDFTSLQFTGALQQETRSITMAEALDQAVRQRPEMLQAEKKVAILRENLLVAKAGHKPEVSVFANYGIRNSLFGNEIDETVHGWTVGARATWALFDGLQTEGKVTQARAQLAQAELDLTDTRRSIELEVRQSYSDYLQTLELLAAEKKVVEQAEESLRLAEARFRAGTGTQLDVLSAQTALTEARSNQAQALHDNVAATATLDRVTGATVRPVE